MEPSVFVTGGTGLLGAHLIVALHRQGIPVRAIYRSAIPEVVRDKADWIEGDLSDPIGLEEAMQGISQVYHVAGLVSFHADDRDALYKVNVEGTANLVNAALSAGVRKLLHVSSVAALGRIRPGETIHEGMRWTPETSNSLYGKTKYLGELEAWRGRAEGLQVVVVNPTIILGEYGHWSSGSMQIFESIAQGFPWYSTGSTGFVDAEDVALAMIALMQSSVEGEKFIVSAENLAYRDLFFMTADALGVKRPHRQVTPFLAAIAWRLEKLKSLFTGKKPLITKETARTGLAQVTFNNQKLLKALPAFAYRPMQQSVERISAAYRSQIHG